ncbi:MAG: hypothetical protein AAF570_09430 [Bacteroidota bacterium]
MARKYPKLKQPFDQQLAQAQKIWDEASNLSDEEKKIDQMANANRTLTKGFVGGIQDFERQRTKIKNLIIDVQRADLSPNERNAAATARDLANMAIREGERRLREGTKSISSANTMVRQINQDVQNATKGLKRILDTAKKKEKQNQKQNDKKNGNDRPTTNNR